MESCIVIFFIMVILYYERGLMIDEMVCGFVICSDLM